MLELVANYQRAADQMAPSQAAPNQATVQFETVALPRFGLAINSEKYYIKFAALRMPERSNRHRTAKRAVELQLVRPGASLAIKSNGVFNARRALPARSSGIMSGNGLANKRSGGFRETARRCGALSG
jgi:hypothetical protein